MERCGGGKTTAGKEHNPAASVNTRAVGLHICRKDIETPVVEKEGL